MFFNENLSEAFAILMHTDARDESRFVQERRLEAPNLMEESSA